MDVLSFFYVCTKILLLYLIYLERPPVIKDPATIDIDKAVMEFLPKGNGIDYSKIYGG
jgi:hypothetical protein